MAQRIERDPMQAAMAALLSQGLDGAGEALRILVDEASKIERAHHLNAQPYERTDGRRDHANGFKPKTVMTRMGEITFAVPQVKASLPGAPPQPASGAAAVRRRPGAGSPPVRASHLRPLCAAALSGRAVSRSGVGGR